MLAKILSPRQDLRRSRRANNIHSKADQLRVILFRRAVQQVEVRETSILLGLDIINTFSTFERLVENFQSPCRNLQEQLECKENVRPI